MKINGYGSTSAIEAKATVDGKARTASGAESTTPVDAVSLSAAATGEGFDAAKVEALKAAIAAGTFKVNPEAIADKLIAGVVDLIAPKH